MTNKSQSKTLEVFGELVCEGIGTYQITQTKTIVGRNSQTADLVIQSSNHVSRQHIEVKNHKFSLYMTHMTYDDVTFYVLEGTFGALLIEFKNVYVKKNLKNQF